MSSRVPVPTEAGDPFPARRQTAGPGARRQATSAPRTVSTSSLNSARARGVTAAASADELRWYLGCGQLVRGLAQSGSGSTVPSGLSGDAVRRGAKPGGGPPRSGSGQRVPKGHTKGGTARRSLDSPGRSRSTSGSPFFATTRSAKEIYLGPTR